ncbi:FtsX-like permease family protein [Microbacterium aerolatum]|uniref:Permease n=1 Tax=Microbacterium aerolatum TaxID=153731 RepID=A0A511ACM9_9MICO|nr:FtsX-like permease family protein [Microbacterium aerolatum]MCK3768276.1 FtsX-like permease family protein [Microbacterium aerolatum]GEK85925.1 permease [Microbacterium aerolatum]GGB28255.1 permease [Microbacterium aerolatum]
MNRSVIAMLLRPAREQSAVLALPGIAFAVVTALVLTVIGGAQEFWTWTDADAGLYQALAAIALVLLVVPLANLGGAAARLSARRRDERLSTLRLLGVSPAGVVGVTVLESTLIAATGALAGFVGYLALTPLIGLIAFRGEPLGVSAVILPPLVIAGVVVSITALATVSAIIGLRSVVISPLGVRTRSDVPRVHWIRAVIAGVVIVAAVAVMQVFPGTAGIAITIIVVAGFFAAALAVLNLVGPWVLKVHARAGLRRAERPQRLLAARLVLESPKAAWRQVSGIAMASFMAVFAGTGVALIDTMSAGPDAAANLMLATDIRTGLIITLIGSFLMVAVSVGVNQASSTLDQRELHRSLHYLGVPLETVDAARTRAVMAPLLLTAIGSALCAAALVLPLIGIALITQPVSIMMIVAVLAAGVGIVWSSTRVTRPLLARSFAEA